MKIQVIGTVIDIIVDANSVYLEESGSKDLSEFLGRVGVSLVKAGATAGLGSLVAAVIFGGLSLIVGASAVPVIAVVGIVVVGYVVAAMVIDKFDDTFNIKTSVAELAR